MSGSQAFPIRIEIPVAWGDQDAFGHLNNVVFFRYCETVRMHFLERAGILAMHEQQGIGVILASAKCDFRKPVKWPHTIHAWTRCSAVGNTSFTMHYRLVDEAGEIVAEGSSVQVMYDYSKAKKVRIPETIRTAIADLQGA